jgi:hypothetical protein
MYVYFCCKISYVYRFSFYCCVLIYFYYYGLILSKALRAQKEAEDESCQIALGNLRAELISLRNEALEKDKILLSLVDRLKASEARLDAQTKVHKVEIENLKKQLAETSEKFEVAMVKHEISEIENPERKRMPKSSRILKINATKYP